MGGHHAEAFIEDGVLDGKRPIGWQCFTCGAEKVGYPDLGGAQSGADAHEARATEVGGQS